MKNSSEQYDADYYERGLESGRSLYSNYRWIPELTIPLAHALIKELGIRSEDSILDYGCAKGFLVKAFRLLDYDAYGYDVSEYAINCCDSDVECYVSAQLPSRSFDVIISKDVFEHISYEMIDSVVKWCRDHCSRMLVVVPLGIDGRYVVPAYERDSTHIIREDIGWWCDLLNSAGFKVDCRYLLGRLKRSWVDQYPTGNGFLLCE